MLTRRKFRKLLSTRYYKELKHLYEEHSAAIADFNIYDIEYCLNLIAWLIKPNIKHWHLNYLCSNKKYLHYCWNCLKNNQSL